MAQLQLPEVYRVGGSVRDELLGRQSKDSDYMVRGASLSEVGDKLHEAGGKVSPLRLRSQGNQIGPQVGWRSAVKGLGLLEIVLPRVETSTGPGRHDFSIWSDPAVSLEMDAVRRDFTINALYKDVRTGEIHDPLNGRDDLQHSWIRTTHSNSFADDPLRTLRALRFVSKLPGFTLVESTFMEMCDHAQAVTGLTKKGVSGTAFDELCGILMGSNPRDALTMGADSGVLQVLIPELEAMIGFEQRSRYHEKTTSDHTFDAVQAAAAMHSHAPLRVRLALLFHDSGKPLMAWTGEDGLDHYYALDPKRAVELGAGPNSVESHEDWGVKQARAALLRLNAPKKLRKDVEMLIQRHMLPLHENIKPFKIRKLRAELGDEMLRDLITHRLADVIGKGGDTSEACDVLAWVANEQQRAIEAKVPLSVKDLKINGRELVDIGLRGRDIGDVQAALLHDVLAQPKLNENQWLMTRAEKLRKEKAK